MRVSHPGQTGGFQTAGFRPVDRCGVDDEFVLCTVCRRGKRRRLSRQPEGRFGAVSCVLKRRYFSKNSVFVSHCGIIT